MRTSSLKDLFPRASGWVFPTFLNVGGYPADRGEVGPLRNCICGVSRGDLGIRCDTAANACSRATLRIFTEQGIIAENNPAESGTHLRVTAANIPEISTIKSSRSSATVTHDRGTGVPQGENRLIGLGPGRGDVAGGAAASELERQ